MIQALLDAGLREAVEALESAAMIAPRGKIPVELIRQAKDALAALKGEKA